MNLPWLWCLASKGYPGAYPKGEKIEISQSLPPSSSLIHAGTELSDDGSILSSGGRVLGAVGTGCTLEDAKRTAYRLCESVNFLPNITVKILVIVSFPDVIRFNLAIHAQSEEG